jgi:hypothetical protein
MGTHPRAHNDVRPPVRLHAYSRRSYSDVTDPPDRAVAVVRHQERAILCYGDSHWAPPSVVIVDDEAGHKVFVLAGGDAVFQDHPNDLASGLLRHSCGFALANKGADFRVIQDNLRHRDPRHTTVIRGRPAGGSRGCGSKPRRPIFQTNLAASTR